VGGGVVLGCFGEEVCWDLLQLVEVGGCMGQV
jgi:hypothetical protein